MASAELWRTLAGWVESGRACALCTVVRAQGAVPRQPGARMVICQDGLSVGTVGGGALELEVTAAAQSALVAGEPRLLSFELKPDLGMLCGGKVEVFVEPLRPPERLYVFGAGHLGQALAPLASRVGFAVTVIDSRAELACRERFPDAVAFVSSFDAAEWSALQFDAALTYCVVVTPSHRTDLTVVNELLRRPCRYVGMIGSRKKRLTVEAALRELGVAAERIDELRSPVGEPIGAETPEEIAVSIVAELVRFRRSCPTATAPTK